MRTWRSRRFSFVSAIAAITTLLGLLLASANPIEESVARAAGSPLGQELTDLLLFMQDEASVPYELFEP